MPDIVTSRQAKRMAPGSRLAARVATSAGILPGVRAGASSVDIGYSSFDVLIAAANSAPFWQEAADLVCPGAVDETSIQALIDSYGATTKRYGFAPGDYYFSPGGSITVTNDNDQLIGSAPKPTIHFSATVGAMFLNGLAGNRISGFRFIGAGGGDYTFGPYLGAGSVVTNCEMIDCGAYMPAVGATMRSCSISGYPQYGFYLGNDDCSLINCSVNAVGFGFDAMDYPIYLAGQNNLVRGGTISGTYNAALNNGIYCAGGVTGLGSIVEQVRFVNLTSNDAILVADIDSLIQDNRFGPQIALVQGIQCYGSDAEITRNDFTHITNLATNKIFDSGTGNNIHDNPGA